MTDNGDKTQLTHPVTEDDHRRGPDTAPVTVVMYGDYECPDTQTAHSSLKRLRERLGNDLRVVFRHFPRTNVHPHAEQAAVLTEAAADNGQFWEMHDKLMDYIGPLDETALARYASEHNIEQVSYDSGHQYVRQVHEDIAGGRQMGLNETPAVYINGRRHDGSYDERSLEAAIRAAR